MFKLTFPKSKLRTGAQRKNGIKKEACSLTDPSLYIAQCMSCEAKGELQLFSLGEL